MKITTITPQEFQAGSHVTLPPKRVRKPWKPLPPQPLRVGTITPEQFLTGEPFVGYARRRVRHANLDQTLKPLPEAIVATLLDDDDDDIDEVRPPTDD